jgi:hypothetical protein
VGRYSAQTISSYKATCVHPYRFRYSNATLAVVDDVVSALELYRALVVALTSTTSANLFAAVRLRKVELWGSPDPATGIPATCKIEWSTNAGGTGLNSGPSTAISDTVMGTGKYCHVRSVPPANCLAGFWLNGAIGTSFDLFEFSIPVNGIMDITIDAVLNYAEPAIAGPALVGATAGTLYIRDLAGMTPVDPLNSI